MAMGCSFTGGFLADNQLHEYRGAAFSCGGDQIYQHDNKDIPSIPNFFKRYNPNLKGFSTGMHFVEINGLWHYNSNDHLNAAQSFAFIEDLKGQTDYLVKNLNSGEYGNASEVLNSKWKHLTVYIGVNNVCNSCSGDLRHSPENFESQLNSALEYIHGKIPKVLVSLISLPKFSILDSMQSGACKLLHGVLSECPCVFRAGSEEDKSFADKTSNAYNNVMRRIYNQWNARANETSDFAVIYHPFNELIVFPNSSYLSTVDCFHPSLLLHREYAIATWNSLFLPMEKRSLQVNFDESKVEFPTDIPIQV
jgi:phospholipase B1